MKKSLVVGIIVLLLLIGFYPALAIDTIKESNPLISNGNTLYVGGSGPGNYTKIQEAIDDASDGDTVFVYDESSPYYENLIVNKAITLMGEAKNSTKIYSNIIEGNEVEGVVNIYSNNVNMCEFTIGNGRYGIFISLRYKNNIITSNIILNNDVGIYFDKSNKNTITKNIISNNDYGIAITECHFHNIRDNTIINNERGIFFKYSFGNKVIGNDITLNKEFGLLIKQWGSNFIIKNNFIDNDIDAYFEQAIIGNRWLNNYWNEPLILPKIIYGKLILVGHSMPIELIIINFDWHPAKEPYEIGV